MGLGATIKHAVSSVFTNSVERTQLDDLGSTVQVTTTRPDRPRAQITAERTIISSIYTRLAVDVSGIKIEHCDTDPETGQWLKTRKSFLNECLNVEANIDQAGRHLRQDIALTLFQVGVAAVVPVDLTDNPLMTMSWDVKSLRVGVITKWEPQYVTVRLYNERNGKHQELRLPKRIVAIIENPFYAVMNEPNSTLQRLMSKLSMLDHVDEISSKGKLDIIIQLPYVVKSDARKLQADRRRKDMEEQLSESTYGIAYADATEKITQLNRSVENNLLEQIKYLKEELYNELGLSEKVFNGTAELAEIQNYTNRTIEPLMDAIVENLIRKFITKTARSQGQTLMYFDTPLKLIPIAELGTLIDALSRNQVATPNELRPAIGLKPSSAPQANELLNSNMPLDQQAGGDLQNGSELVNPADEEEAELDGLMAELGVA
jgi:hypothetical protein